MRSSSGRCVSSLKLACRCGWTQAKDINVSQCTKTAIQTCVCVCLHAAIHRILHLLCAVCLWVRNDRFTSCPPLDYGASDPWPLNLQSRFNDPIVSHPGICNHGNIAPTPPPLTPPHSTPHAHNAAAIPTTTMSYSVSSQVGDLWRGVCCQYSRRRLPEAAARIPLG